MKISFLILSGFFLILLLFSITTYINYQQSEKVDENSEKFSKSSTTLRNSNRFQRNILNLASGLRGYLLTNEPFFIQSYDSAVIENEQILGELRSITSDNVGQKKLLDEIDSLYDRWGREFAQPLLEAKKQAMISDSAAKSFDKFYRNKLSEVREDEIQQTIQRKFREFTNSEYTFREEQRKTLTASVQQTRNISFYLTILSIALGIGIAGFLASHISSAIVKMVEMADSISAGNYNVHVDNRGMDEISRLTTSLNNMAKVLAEQITLLNRKNEELNQFAHIVSHDVKTPLRGIDNVVSWIEEDHDVDIPRRVKEYIGMIKGRVRRAESLLNGILSYSRIGREVQKKEIVSVSELIDEIKGYLPDKKGITLIVQHPLPELYTEKLPLFQVFSNLLNNAYHYHNKENGIVKVFHKDMGDHYKFFVEDNGPGIAKNYHEKIFVIFQTLQEGDSSESTGVGLAIVKKILTDRKLQIEVTSEPGNGSTFSFTWAKH
jgi:signal transduction histidine kinase